VKRINLETHTEPYQSSWDGEVPGLGRQVRWRSTKLVGRVLYHFVEKGTEEAPWIGVYLGFDKAPDWANAEQRARAPKGYAYGAHLFGAECEVL
jgi:hypothetical protein